MARCVLVVLVVLCLFATIIESGKKDAKDKKLILQLEECLKKGKRKNALIFTNEFV